MSFVRSPTRGQPAGRGEAEPASRSPAPGKVPLTSQLPGTPVQQRANDAEATADVHAAAAHGITGAATAMPHADQIQRSFGRHEVVALEEGKVTDAEVTPPEP